MKNGFEWQEQWQTESVYHVPGLPRGDVETRAFRLDDGRDGYVQTDRLSGGMYSYLYVEGDLIEKYPQSWGFPTKAEAKKNCVRLLREYAERSAIAAEIARF